MLELNYLSNNALVLSLNLLAIPLFSTQELPLYSQAIFRKPLEVAEYKPPKGLGSPPTTGGGTRGGKCEQDRENTGLPLTALMPAITSESDWGLTVEGYPQFFVYVPKTSALTAEFVLKDENENDIYRTNFSIAGEAGIVGFSLPRQVAALQNGKTYHWYFSIVCNPRNRRWDVTVSGWTRRIELSQTLGEIQKAAPRDRSQLYAQNGIWHEALATLAEERRKAPKDTALAAEWRKLLESAGLRQLDRFPVTLIRIEGSP